MSMHKNKSLHGRKRRKIRVRKKIFGTEERPRLSVFRSAKHIYAQVIDDVNGVTVAASSTMDKKARDSLSGGKRDRAKAIGISLAEACKAKSITSVIFDRNGFKYHGRIKAVADGARESGLKF